MGIGDLFRRYSIDRDEWLRAFLPLHKQAVSLIDDITHAAKRHDIAGREDMWRALMQASAKLPAILKSVQNIPPPNDPELDGIAKDFEQAFKAYIDSCKYSIKYVKHFRSPPFPTRFNVFKYTVWEEKAKSAFAEGAAKAKLAADKMERVTERFARYVGRDDEVC